MALFGRKRKAGPMEVRAEPAVPAYVQKSWDARAAWEERGRGLEERTRKLCRDRRAWIEALARWNGVDVGQRANWPEHMTDDGEEVRRAVMLWLAQQPGRVFW